MFDFVEIIFPAAPAFFTIKNVDKSTNLPYNVDTVKKPKERAVKKIFFTVNIILIVAVLIGGACFTALGGLPLKGVTSAGFVILGAVNLAYAFLTHAENRKYPVVMLVGLAFAMSGDVVLNIHFIGGAILFDVGHVFYFAAYCFLHRFKPIDLVYGAALFVPSALLITLAPIFDFGGVAMEIVCVIYAAVISCMVGKAVSNLVAHRSLLNVILTVGSCLFFFSDLMLLFNVFGDLPRIADILCLATYYPAQCLLAFSVFVGANANREDRANDIIAREAPEL